MIKQRLPLSYTTLVVLITLLFICFNAVEAVSDPSKSTEPKQTPTNTPPQKSETAPIAVPNDSVLHLIPKGTLGVIYCPSLLELDNRINTLAAELAPEWEIPDVSAKVLAQTLGMEFESLADFEEIGLDLNQDFAILLTSLQPLHVSALAHLTDPEAMKLTIEAKGSVPTQYKGVTYWNTTEGSQSFAILENTLVFSTPQGVCENVIDMHNGMGQAITQNPNYSVFLTDILEETDQLGVCFDIETAIATLDGPLEEKLGFIINTVQEGDEEAFKAIAPFLEDMPEDIPEEEIKSIERVQSISARLKVEGTDLQIKPFLKLRSDSEFLKMLEEVSGELAFLDELPDRALMNGAVQGCPKLLVELTKSLLATFPQKTPEQQAQRDLLAEEIKNFHESLVDRWSVSIHFEGALFPNYLFIYELKDEQAARTYMDEVFSEHLHAGGVYAGKSMMHNRAEIKSYIFPKITEELPEEFPEELAGLMPTESHWYYAFTEGQLLFATGVGPESIQMALERRIGSEEKFSDHPSYQELVDILGTDNNIFVALSPVISAKSIAPLVGEMDQPNAAMQIVAGLFMNLPENYSVGFSAKARDGGIDAKLFLKLGDFKQLTQMLGMMFQAGQMQ